MVRRELKMHEWRGACLLIIKAVVSLLSDVGVLDGGDF